MNQKSRLREYLAMSWHFAIEASEWEGENGYWAWVSELPNCSTFGYTQSEALSSVAEMLPAYLEAAIQSNAPIPEPESREPAMDEMGGTIVLRIPKSLHYGLKQAANSENTSLNQFALYALTKAVCQTTKPAKAATARRPSTKKAAANKSTGSRPATSQRLPRKKAKQA